MSPHINRMKYEHTQENKHNKQTNFNDENFSENKLNDNNLENTSEIYIIYYIYCFPE